MSSFLIPELLSLRDGTLNAPAAAATRSKQKALREIDRLAHWNAERPASHPKELERRRLGDSRLDLLGWIAQGGTSEWEVNVPVFQVGCRCYLMTNPASFEGARWFEGSGPNGRSRQTVLTNPASCRCWRK